MLPSPIFMEPQAANFAFKLSALTSSKRTKEKLAETEIFNQKRVGQRTKETNQRLGISMVHKICSSSLHPNSSQAPRTDNLCTISTFVVVMPVFNRRSEAHPNTLPPGDINMFFPIPMLPRAMSLLKAKVDIVDSHMQPRATALAEGF